MPHIGLSDKEVEELYPSLEVAEDLELEDITRLEDDKLYNVGMQVVQQILHEMAVAGRTRKAGPTIPEEALGQTSAATPADRVDRGMAATPDMTDDAAATEQHTTTRATMQQPTTLVRPPTTTPTTTTTRPQQQRQRQRQRLRSGGSSSPAAAARLEGLLLGLARREAGGGKCRRASGAGSRAALSSNWPLRWPVSVVLQRSRFQV